MKLKKTLFRSFAFIFLFVFQITAQTKPAAKTAYESVPGDPMKARIYTLANGLKVYMSVYKDAPRIQTFIAVKAGSKNDPKDATGLAHYLEHMLFKGTDKYGALDYKKEAPELQKIEDLYEVYRKTTEPAARKKIYHQIDSISGVAAKFAIANEYDKMTAALGCDGTNAFTSFEQTVYVNDIPSNQLENWLTLESERFRNPVMRIFHTELEAVYEEKNMSLDSDQDKVWDGLFGGLFQNHTYGTQTTIGTIEHLKNPSIKEIKKYYKTHYVPNNMAIVLAGDFDPDKTIELIKKKFGYMKKQEVPAFTFLPEKEIGSPVVKEAVGPEAESVSIGFRFAGAGTADADMLSLISKIMYNRRAGLIDLNLVQKQRVVDASAGDYGLNDYTCFFLDGYPMEGQSLESVKDLLLEQINELKSGNFPDWMLQAVINQMKLQNLRRLESNSGRAQEMLGSFTSGLKWKYSVEEINRLSKITKQQIVDFAGKRFSENYVVVYKRKGEDTKVQKVEKPEITPVEVNRDKESPFLLSVLNANPPPISPVFTDYEKDIVKLKLKNGLPLNYLENKENGTFNLYYVFDMGSYTDNMWPLAVRYLEFLGTGKYSSEEIAQEFYKIGCSFDVFTGDDQIYVSLSGLTENFAKGLELFEHLLKDAQPDGEAYKKLVANILKEREDAKLNKDIILYNGLVSYAKYGKDNPFKNIISADNLSAIDPGQLTDLIHSLEGYQHRVLFYGSMKKEALQTLLEKNHPMEQPKEVPPMKKYNVNITGKDVYVVDFDMKQAEVIMMAKGPDYDPSLIAEVTLYNEYFGGGMSSIVFQDLRESKALAYSAGSYFNPPSKKESPFLNSASIGTQADKLKEALAGMEALLREMPKSDIQFESAKASVDQRMRTERVTKSGILFEYEAAQKLGLKENISKRVFEKLNTMNMKSIFSFQDKYVKNMQYSVVVIGKQSELDIKALEKYGKVTFLSLKEVFGY